MLICDTGAEECAPRNAARAGARDDANSNTAGTIKKADNKFVNLS